MDVNNAKTVLLLIIHRRKRQPPDGAHREQRPGKRGKPRQHGGAQALKTGGADPALQPFMQEIHVNA